MNRKEFEQIVLEVLRKLPKPFKERLSNIDVVVECGRAEEDLLGLYEGVPLNDRNLGYHLAMPDKITLFKRNLEAESRESGKDLREEIRHTIEHEIAHHFGITDEELEDRDIY